MKITYNHLYVPTFAQKLCKLCYPYKHELYVSAISSHPQRDVSKEEYII